MIFEINLRTAQILFAFVFLFVSKAGSIRMDRSSGGLPQRANMIKRNFFSYPARIMVSSPCRVRLC
jgi:hypothetical protein